VTTDYKRSTSQRSVNRGEKVSTYIFEVPIIVSAVKEELILLVATASTTAKKSERNRKKKGCKCIPSWIES